MPVDFETAISSGVAPVGGLFVPATLPAPRSEATMWPEKRSEIAEELLSPFVGAGAISRHLPAICSKAMSTFPSPLRAVDEAGKLQLLELFHGPTAAFKDLGASFLAAFLGQVADPEEMQTILVATSGDTGAAVAAAFEGNSGFRVVILYPDGLVSPRQAHQLSCWRGNVHTLAVSGDFDDCQRLAKGAFADHALSTACRLTSANSINPGRLLPQMVYYAEASLSHFRRTGRKPGFVIPTGNVGNAFACLLARRLGLPVGDVVLAANANRPLADFLETGRWEPRATVATLASAMDVGNPSNVERLRWLYPDFEELRSALQLTSIPDAGIEQAVRTAFARWQHHLCPHTATAFAAWCAMDEDTRERDWILVATAHPAKFDTVVEPLTDVAVRIPDQLARLLARPASRTSLAPDPHALRSFLQEVAVDEC